MVITLLSFSLYACSCSICLGPLELLACGFVHHSLFTLWSKAKVSDQVYLVKELPYQVILVFHYLGQLVDSKAKVFFTLWTKRKELCGAQMHTG